METQTLAICSNCNQTIKPNEGFIVHGNIYRIVENLEERAGIIGNNFPATCEEGLIVASEINEVAYHNSCLKEILFNEVPIR